MTSLTLQLATAEDTERLGQDIGLALVKGDLVTLSGDLGAGKSTLARGLIRTIANDSAYEVPSPTFTIVQSYPELRLPVSHVDLYRLSSGEEVDELGLEEALEDGAVLVEWPERAEGALGEPTLRITLLNDGDGRKAEIEGEHAALARVQRSLAIRTFLGRAGYATAPRRYLLGDASARGYEMIDTGCVRPLILMNSPYNPGGPILRDGKTYMQIAHLSQSVTAFVAVNHLLRSNGFYVPQIMSDDLDNGFLLLENLGNEGIIDADGAPIVERYEASVRLLARMHERSWTRDVEVAKGYTHHIHDFDRDAMLIEVELLSDWYAPRIAGLRLTPEQKTAYVTAWDRVFSRLILSEKSLVQRDFHSPNILWRSEASGIDRIGLLDFQDAMIGPSAYDVASIVLDARVTIEPKLQKRLLAAYIEERQSRDSSFNESAFLEAFSIMGAQRNAKILGIFVRLDERDGKPYYLKHIPRIQAYLAGVLDHPSLAPVREWCENMDLLSLELQ